MRHSWVLLVVLGVVLIPGFTTGAAAQTAARNAPAEPTPRLPDGTVNLGRVNGEKGAWNLNGVLNFAQIADGHPEKFDIRLAGPASGGAEKEPWIPFKPWSAAVYNYNALNDAKYDPEAMCLPPGGPRMIVTPYPMEIIQQPENKRVLMLFEGGAHIWREIYMDGRPHPPRNSFLGGNLWSGHSVGHYEDNGNTLVIDTVGFNEGTWLDRAGHVHTDQLHTVEKFSRPNKNTLHYEAVIDDPGAYTKPWPTLRWDTQWTQREMMEYICQGNNQYLNNLKDDFGDPVLVREQSQ